VVADLGSFKAYKLEQGTSHSTARLELIEEINLAGPQVKLPVMDLSGGYHPPTLGKWAASAGERHNIELERKRRLVKQVSHFLNALLRRAGSDGCYLAASKEIAHQILAELPRESRAKIEKIMPVDLTKAEKSELLRRLELPKPKSGETPFLPNREQFRKGAGPRQQL
jgi:hypothetical protein